MILEDHGYVQRVMADKLTGPGHIRLQNGVNDIEDRYKDIIRLEQSVNQVHKLFIEMAALVKLQGEVIDNIEQNVKSAKAHVQKAEKHLVAAKKYDFCKKEKMYYFNYCTRCIACYYFAHTWSEIFLISAVSICIYE